MAVQAPLRLARLTGAGARSRPGVARCAAGTTLVEFSLIAPLFFLLIMGIIDAGIFLWQSNAAAKATHLGARQAVVSAPVASGITTFTWNYELIGDPCLDSATGAANAANGAAYCPSVDTVCTPAADGGACTNGHAFDGTAFAAVFARMQAIYPQLQRQNVQIAYRTTGLGFVGRPGGLPMTVSVSIRCMTYDFVILDSLMGWAVPDNACDGFPPGWRVPPSHTVLTSESLGQV